MPDAVGWSERRSLPWRCQPERRGRHRGFRDYVRWVPNLVRRPPGIPETAKPEHRAQIGRQTEGDQESRHRDRSPITNRTDCRVRGYVVHARLIFPKRCKHDGRAAARDAPSNLWKAASYDCMRRPGPDASIRASQAARNGWSIAPCRPPEGSGKTSVPQTRWRDANNAICGHEQLPLISCDRIEQTPRSGRSCFPHRRCSI
jgi:hypothetical protein